MKTIYIASDHAGVDLKSYLIEQGPNYSWKDLGPDTAVSVDYPDFADKVCRAIKDDENSIGVLICGSGIGMCMRANKFDHIRAALCLTEEMAKLTRLHNNANLLCLGSRLTDNNKCLDILKKFLQTGFEGGRHNKRVEKISLPTKDLV